MAYQSLGLTQTQQQKQTMTMSPLQRQSLDILQLPIMALEQKIREEAQSNPAIEEVVMPKIELDAPGFSNDGVESEAAAQENDDDFQLHETISSSFGSEDAEERRRFMFESLKQPESLEQHLRNQIQISDFSDEEAKICEMIIANLSSTGLLAVTTAEIAEVGNFDLNSVERVLSLMQENFDPPGIAARSASERITLQLKTLKNPNTDLAIRITQTCIDDLAAGGREARIANTLGVSQANVIAAIQLIHSLNPNPVADFDPLAPTDYVIPEIEVVWDKRNQKWIASFNRDAAPRIQINEEMRKLLSDERISGEDRSFIREQLRSAEMLSGCLTQRVETILRVGAAIVEKQQEFFTHGVAKLKPMTHADIATKLGCHETTVGRSVEGKYLRSPQGIFELKYFFSAAIKGGESGKTAISNKAVHDRLLSIVKGEDMRKPYSDQEIMEIMKKEGIEISRRTIAKYRDILHIPPSSRRTRHS